MSKFPKLPQFQYDWCISILDKIEKMHISTEFKTKVDPAQNKDYYNIITQSMDLTTVRDNLKSEQYDSVIKWGQDMRLIFTNAFSYYQPGHPIFMMAQELHEWFEKKFNKYPRSSHEQWLMKLKKTEAKVKKLIDKAPSMSSPDVGQKPQKDDK